MQIETKHKVGDSVFALYHDAVHNVIVTGVYVSLELYAGITVSDITYRVKFRSGGETKISETKLFSSRKDLLDSL